MSEPIRFKSYAELEAALVDLGQHVTYPPTPDLASAVRARLVASPRPFAPGQGIRAFRWGALPRMRAGVVLVVLALALVGGVLLALAPGAWTAVASRLGLRGVTIVQVAFLPTATPTPAPSPTPASTPTARPTPSPTATPVPIGERLALGQRLTLAEAQARVSSRIVTPTLPELGAPDEVYVRDQPVGGQVALVYYPRPGLPATGDTGVGLLLTELRGDVNPGFDPIGKEAGPDTRVEELTVNGGDGYWLEGHPHVVFYRDANDAIQTESIRLAGNTLLWEQGNLTLRLEATLTRDQALRIAGSVR